MNRNAPGVLRCLASWRWIVACCVLLLSSCSSTRWRDADPGSHESGLPRVDMSIVREARLNERVGANQAVDGKAYVLEETHYFRISEAGLGMDAFGNGGLEFKVHPESAKEFEHWTTRNVGRLMGMSIEGELVWVGPISARARDHFMISDASGPTMSQRQKERLERFNAAVPVEDGG